MYKKYPCPCKIGYIKLSYFYSLKIGMNVKLLAKWAKKKTIIKSLRMLFFLNQGYWNKGEKIILKVKLMLLLFGWFLMFCKAKIY